MLSRALRPFSIASVFALLLAACSSNSPADAASDDASDIAQQDAIVDDIPRDTGPPRPAWPHTLPIASTLGEVRGFHTARTIIHSHSVHSHDACDGHPYVDGGVNEPCLQDFRAAVCTAHIDVNFLTEHAGLMAEGPFERVLQLRAGDEPIMENGELIGYRIVCADGQRTIVLPGAENELMPLALHHHPDLTAGMTLDDAYHADDPAGVARFRAAGGIVAIAHTEQRTIDHLNELAPDLVEVYNSHANLDPRIAMPYLGLDVGPIIADILRFNTPSNNLEPDMVFVVFFRESQNDLGKWATLWASGTNMPGIAGSDTHENTFSGLLSDGERGDSYRRIWRSYNNWVRVQDTIDREHVIDALVHGRSFVVFEAYGTPRGFDVFADDGAGAITEMGGTIAAGANVTIHVAAPTIDGLDPMLPTPTIRIRMLRADAAMGWLEVATTTEPTMAFHPTEPGAYRAEIRITPTHLTPYLPRLERVLVETPWIYANPIRVM
jgi:hypothetical protein